ncbi:MAG TPA: hemolysin family protein [Candidatus Paceibacterota bacterium]|nr:hemolysin family protein [Candidatus Paceibacterota bacterium]
MILLMGVFAGMSFFFALAETALLSLNRWQARRLGQEDPVHGSDVAWLLDQPQDLLASLALGNTLANAGIVVLGLGLVLWTDWPTGLILAAVLALILFGGEVGPKALAVRMPEYWSRRIARPMRVWLGLSRPVRRLAQGHTRLLLRLMVSRLPPASPSVSDEEYQELLEMAYQQGTLAESEKEIILQIINLDRRTAREVMRPRAQMACISDDLTIEEMIAAARKHKHRRLPIYDETPDTIVGVLNTRVLLLDPQVDMAEAIELPSFVPASMNLLRLLESLQRQQRGLAIVLDEYGGTAGLVSTEDILEAMIGEIRSEGEAAGFVMEKLREGAWRVNGTMRLDDFRREYPEMGEAAEVETMGGLLVQRLERVPRPGESAVFGGLRLTASQADERRVREILVERMGKRGAF